MATISDERFYPRSLVLFTVSLAILLTTLYGCTEKQKLETEPAAVELIDKVPGNIVHPMEVVFGNKVKLLGVTPEKLSSNQIRITYYWQVMEDLGMFGSVFVHFVDSEDKILFQGDHDLCQKRTAAELKGKIAKETQIIDIPKTAAGKMADIKIGIYDATPPEYERLKVISNTGSRKYNNENSAAAEKFQL